METRNILDSLGHVIGQLSLPIGTSEAIWTASLAQYSVTPVVSPIWSSTINTVTVTGSGATTTSSSTASVIGSMTSMPPAGTYVAIFNGNIYTGGASAAGEFGIYVNGSLLAETRRDISCNLTLLGGLVTVSLNNIGVGTYTGTQVTLDGTQTIDVRFKSNNGGTIGFNERVFTLMKVS